MGKTILRDLAILLVILITLAFDLASVNEILTELYLSDDLNACINKFINRSYRDDFKQDLFLYLQENCSERILELHGRGELKFYLASVIVKRTKDPNRWFRNYGSFEDLPENHAQSADTFDINERLLFEEKEEKMLQEIEHLDDHFKTHFFRNVVKALAKHESMRELSRETGIPRNTISRAVKKVRDHLNEKFK